MKIYKWIPFCCGVFLLEFALVANTQAFSSGGCHLKPSINKGANYYRLKTPWGKWLDMPCAPGTEFVEAKCSCGHADSGKTKFINELTTTTSTSAPISSRSASKSVPVSSHTTSAGNAGVTRQAQDLKLEKSTTVHRTESLLDRILTTPDRKVTTKAKPETAQSSKIPDLQKTSEKTGTSTVSTAKSSISTGTRIKVLDSTTSVAKKLTSPPKPLETKIGVDLSPPVLHSSVEWLSPEADSKLTTKDILPSQDVKTSHTSKPVSTTASDNTQSTGKVKESVPVVNNEMDVQTITAADHTLTDTKVTNPSDFHGQPPLSTKSSSATPFVADNKGTGLPLAADDKSTDENGNGREKDEEDKFVLSELSVVNDVTELIAYPKSSTTTSTTKTITKMTTTVQQPQSTTKLTTTEPVTKNECELRSVPDDVTSYMGYVGEEMGWIQFQCPTGQEFSQDICWCFDPLVETGRTATTFIPPDCQYFKEGRTSFKEYVDFLQSWVYSECSDGYEFSQLKCGCVLAGTLPDAEKQAEKTRPADVKKTTASPKTTVKVPNGCLNIAEGPDSFKSYVESLGVWVYSDCPSGAYFDQASCGCITPEEKARNNCPYRKYGKSSYTHYIPDLGDNVYYQCPDNHVFDEVFCMCIAKGSSKLKHLLTHNSGVTSSTRKPENVTEIVPENCKKIKDGPMSYKEYVDPLGDFVFSDCSIGEVFIQAKCGCFPEGNTNTGTGTDVNLPSTGDNKPATECDKQGTGTSSFKTFVKQINDWVYSECPANHVFNQSQCKCTQQGPACPSIQTGEASFKTFVPDLNDWVHADCPDYQVYSPTLCQCVPQDGDVPPKDKTQAPATTPRVTLQPTNPNCPFEKRGAGYGKYVAQLGEWVYYECPSGQVFDITVCSCEESKDSGFGSDCEYERAEDGQYRKFVQQLNQWTYYQCASDQSFDEGSCKCATEAKDVATSAPVTTKSTVPGTKCMSRPSDMGKEYFIISFPTFGDILYTCDFGYFYSQKDCGCVAKQPIVESTTKQTFVNPKCALQPSDKGPGYFRMQLSESQWVDLACPTNERFSLDKCSCSPPA